MKKTSPKSSKKNGTGAHPLPQNLSLEVAQAVLEDAVMEAAADIAALSATLEEAVITDSPTVMAAILPETPEEQEILALVNVPYLGPARVAALADAGIITLDHLRAATQVEIGSVKGVGLRNAERIKAWLTAQEVVSSPGLPPDPPSLLGEIPESPGVVPVLATVNQMIFDELGEVDQALARLRQSLGTKNKSKKLERQFDILSTVTSELAEGPDTLSDAQLQESVKILDEIVGVLNKSAEQKPLSEKKQEALREVLRKQRKALERVLGD